MAGNLRFRGDRLRALRTGRELSQAQLGSAIGAHVTSISDWERGDNQPSPRHVLALAGEFGVQVETFYEPDEQGDDDSAQLWCVLQATLLEIMRRERNAA